VKFRRQQSVLMAACVKAAFVGDNRQADIWDYESKQQADTISQEDVRRNISGEELEQIRELKIKVQQLGKYLSDTNDSLVHAELALMNSNNSITWRMAKKLHAMIDGFLPLGTRSRMLARRILFSFAVPQPIK